MISIVTSTFNAAPFIARSLASVARQTGRFEHIVVDAGSRDGTAELCRRAGNIELIVIPGSSIYQAWSAGIAASHGDIIVFLNADDELAPDAVATIESVLAQNLAADIAGGRASFVDDENPTAQPTVLIAAPSGQLDVAQLTTGAPAINAMAFRRSVFERFGVFETSFGVAGDRAFLLRLALAEAPPKIVQTDAILYCYHVHTGSLTLKRGLEQRVRIARAHIALSRALLREGLPPTAALWLRHLHRRERIVASLHCLAAGHFATAWELIRGCPDNDGATRPRESSSPLSARER